ncbi:Crossover junction endodeoxyribonuclease RuvC [Frankliniella fusca]|uniref:Crossover junction endodeoxyribonuclease RuvC n=1 Tax=Frankliniella fusca TaxID=407009 RepID=A0AAE1HLS8_9NEOP|nr:Crossover junction endodeoxyribonuclease RuvC [Frankliniella fusca]
MTPDNLNSTYLEQVGFLDAVHPGLGVHHVEDEDLLEGDHAAVHLGARPVHHAELALADAPLHHQAGRGPVLAAAGRGVQQREQLRLRHGAGQVLDLELELELELLEKHKLSFLARTTVAPSRRLLATATLRHHASSAGAAAAAVGGVVVVHGAPSAVNIPVGTSRRRPRRDTSTTTLGHLVDDAPGHRSTATLGHLDDDDPGISLDGDPARDTPRRRP